MKKLLFNEFIGGRTGMGLLVLRIVVGAAFMLHGWPKIQNPTGWMPADAGVPGWLQALAAISEFGGGAAWILGLLTPLASFGILCTMAVAVHFHAIIRGDPFVAKGPSYELALVFLCVALLLILAGPGKYSLDYTLFGHKKTAKP